VGDKSRYVFRKELLGEDGNVRRSVVVVKHPGLFSPKFGATSSHVFTQSPLNVAVEPGIHSLACGDKFFVLPQLLYKWQHKSGMFWKPFCIVEFSCYNQRIELNEAKLKRRRLH
jgi:hypothetical protein